MFSRGRYFPKSLTTAVASFSSKMSRLDPRTDEFKKRVVPWESFSKEKRKLFQALPHTKILKMLSSPWGFENGSFKLWLKKKALEQNSAMQLYDSELHATLGNNIYIGHVLLHLDAGLLYKGKPWMKGYTALRKLPKAFEEGWVVEAIDLSNCTINFVGIRNFNNLNEVHTIKAHNCPYIDDWCLDMLCCEVLGLENLDLSGCKQISPSGLIPLTRLPNLRTLDLSNCPAFETTEGKLMCLLLQDCNERLDIHGIELPELPDSVGKMA